MYRVHRTAVFAVALAVLALFAGPARAEGTFEVGGIHVDASGKSTAEARSTAIANGRAPAWGTLFRRLTRQQDWGRQPNLDAATLQRMVIGYFPVNERRSTTRYVADVTYTFNPEMIARVLQQAGIPYTVAAAKRILLIPMAPGFSHASAWTAAFASPRFAVAPVPFAVPAGDAADMAALSGLNFDTAGWDQVAPVAARIKATEAVLVLAVPAGNKLQVIIKRIGQGVLPVKSAFDVPLLQGPVATYPSAADATVKALDDMWKNQKAVDYGQKGKLVADVHIASLQQFAALENALAGVPNVAAISVTAIDVGQARLTVSYLGSIDQLKAALAQSGFWLKQNGGVWQISQGAAPGQQ
jgi:hypothetical protein